MAKVGSAGSFASIYAKLTICLVLAACGGSGGSNQIGSGGEQGSQPDPQPDTSAGIAILPAEMGQPNTIAPSVAVDSNGTLHAAYSDIDGRGFYASCSASCGNAAQWTSVEILNQAIESTGSLTPKIRIDGNDNPHVAFAVLTNGGVLSPQNTFYGTCTNQCTSAQGWSVDSVYANSTAHGQQRLQTTDWFALSATGQPRFVFVEPDGDFLSFSVDSSVYFIACNSNCDEPINWSRQQVAGLSVAADRPASIEFDAQGRAHIALTYNVLPADSSDLLYVQCTDNCDSVTPAWSAVSTLVTLPDSVFAPLAFSLHTSGTGPVIAVLSDDGNAKSIELWRCNTACASAADWSRSNITAQLPLPANIVSLGQAIDLRIQGSQLDLALIAKRQDKSLDTLAVKLSCSIECADNNWTYEQVADTGPIELPDEGICLFVGVGVRPPITLVGDSVGLVLYPHWACGGSGVEIFEPDTGLRYIDYNADVRFYEIAAIVD